jgi:hypothetical protein
VLYHKDSECTGQQTLYISVIKSNLLKAYKAKGTVSSESHTKYINEIYNHHAEFFNFKAGSTYSNRQDLKGKFYFNFYEYLRKYPWDIIFHNPQKETDQLLNNI